MHVGLWSVEMAWTVEEPNLAAIVPGTEQAVLFEHELNHLAAASFVIRGHEDVVFVNTVELEILIDDSLVETLVKIENLDGVLAHLHACLLKPGKVFIDIRGRVKHLRNLLEVVAHFKGLVAATVPIPQQPGADFLLVHFAP